MWTHDNTLEAFALGGASLAFIAGLLQYRTAQRWKRMEWIAAAVQQFLDDPHAQRAMRMIDWHERRVLLFPDDPDPERRYVRFNDDMVARALLPHEDGGRFTSAEAAIRDVFDRYLDRLSFFGQFVRRKLITAEELRPHLEYWIRSIADIAEAEGAPASRLRGLHTYIQAYEFTDVQYLFEVFGLKLQEQPPNELQRLRSLDPEALYATTNRPLGSDSQ